ncbi:glycosyltransferase [Umezawaea sp.]|uniref:glycosyltransferase n=1 Tax=Umezawaea sp. TaxID=1955258 RepID=UPI002ED09EB4
MAATAAARPDLTQTRCCGKEVADGTGSRFTVGRGATCAAFRLGFGSMARRGAQRTAAFVAEAVRTSGVRAVVATGWGGIAPEVESGDVLVIDQALHDWLFPRMSAIVHHGGSGATGAALASGHPQVVCPFVADQPHWAARMHAVDVAPAPLRQQDLTADRLARVVNDVALRERAEHLGELIRAQDGVTVAVDALERLS